jgi:prolipoprotein diacylglyceryltransferase
VRYREEHVECGLAPRFVGIRLFPLQLAEAGAAAAIVTAGSLAILGGAGAGTALALYIVAYGAVRFAFECARGDHGRGELAGMSQPQWLSLASGIVVLLLGAHGTLPVGPLHVALTACLAGAAVWLAARGTGRRAAVPS